MSHTVTIKAVEVRNAAALEAACRRCKLDAPQVGLHRLFDGTKREGHAVKLKDWHMPVVFDLTTGEALYDNYNGSWGNESHLDELIQGYAIEAAEAEARLAGYSNITETVEANGDVVVRMEEYAS